MTNQPNWHDIAHQLQKGRIVLVLGPEAATLERAGERVSFQTLLTEHLAVELRRRKPDAVLAKNATLAYVAKSLEDAIFQQEVAGNSNFKTENAKTQLNETIAYFYQNFHFKQFPLYEKLAQMEFNFVVETNPAPWLAKAMKNENKFSTQAHFYHYAYPTHNNSEAIKKIKKEEIQPDSPLIYHLLGGVEQPASLIVTERDQLAFLDSILQQEITAGIPNSVAIHFTSVRDKEVGQEFDKTFLFLGFDFNDWQLRLILHLIGRFQRQKATYALQDPHSLGELTTFFYQNNFDVHFVGGQTEVFLDNIEREYQMLKRKETEKKKAASPKLNVFLMYADGDETHKNELDLQLSPLKTIDFIETWNADKISAGGIIESEIAERIAAADVILLLVSANFFSSEKVFERQFQTAIERHRTKKCVIFPLLMRSCDWKGALPDELKRSTLPRNQRFLNQQPDAAAALADTVQQLRGHFEIIAERKNQTAP